MTRLGCTKPRWCIGNWCMAKPPCSDITIRTAQDIHPTVNDNKGPGHLSGATIRAGLLFRSLKNATIPPQTRVVWVHPFGGGWRCLKQIRTLFYLYLPYQHHYSFFPVYLGVHLAAHCLLCRNIFLRSTLIACIKFNYHYPLVKNIYANHSIPIAMVP